MPFRFRLQKVLDARQRKVDAASRELAAAGRRTAAVAEEIRNLDHEVGRLQQSGAAASADFRVDARHHLTRWLEHLSRQREGLCARLAEARAEEQRLHAEMTRAWQDLDVLKRLEDRQRKHWQAEQIKRENREMDEIGVQRADRSRRAKVAWQRAQVSAGNAPDDLPDPGTNPQVN